MLLSVEKCRSQSLCYYFGLHSQIILVGVTLRVGLSTVSFSQLHTHLHGHCCAEFSAHLSGQTEKRMPFQISEAIHEIPLKINYGIE